MPGEKILLIEDNAVNRDLTLFLLESRGYEVLEAASAEEGFEILKSERPDLIVMDIQLPGMDGLEATKRLKANPPTRDIPVLALTSYAMKGDRDAAAATGCVGYVTKPIDRTLFLREITAHLPARPKPR